MVNESIELLRQEVAELKEQLKKEKENKDFWCDRYNEIYKKFTAFRDSVKGIVILIDNQN